MDGDCLAGNASVSRFTNHRPTCNFFFTVDVFLTCKVKGTTAKSFQIWTNGKEKGFSLARAGTFPPNVGAVSFADMGEFFLSPSPHFFPLTGPLYRICFTLRVDRDGTIDMVFPSCASVNTKTGVGYDCAINIAYNEQKPLCTSSTPAVGRRNCRLPEELCTADPDFRFDFHQGSGDDVVSDYIPSLPLPTNPC